MADKQTTGDWQPNAPAALRKASAGPTPMTYDEYFRLKQKMQVLDAIPEVRKRARETDPAAWSMAGREEARWASIRAAAKELGIAR